MSTYESFIGWLGQEPDAAVNYSSLLGKDGGGQEPGFALVGWRNLRRDAQRQLAQAGLYSWQTVAWLAVLVAGIPFVVMD